MKKTLSLFAISIVIFIVYFLFATHQNIDAHSYVGEKECSSCHTVESHSLQLTLHPKIFRPVTSLDMIVGDFSTPNSLRNFKKTDIDFVVGSKWEQIYLQKKNNDEYKILPATWMIATQEWVPTEVHEKDAVSRECNACHTTGYSRIKHTFSEYGVRCEACHGPAGAHVAHQKIQSEFMCKVCHTEVKNTHDDIVLTQKSAVCGQCHTRGTTTISSNGKTTLFNFPLEYLPGNNNVKATFTPSSPKTDKTHQNWWGVGLSKNRHQEFADFSFSKHSKSLINLKTKKNPHGGKKDESCLECHSEDYRSAKEGEKPTISQAKLGITCVTCHEPHGIERNIRSKKSLDAKCGECHIFDMKREEKHYPCPSSKASCVGCHMPLIAKTGGTYTIRSHAFKIIPPQATKKYNMPSSCQNGACHQDKSVEWAIEAYNKFYKTKGLQTLQDVIKGKN